MQSEDSNIDHEVDKLEIIRATHKAIIDIIQNPVQGRQGTSKEERAELRKEIAADALTCMEVALTYSQFHDGLFDVLNIANKLKSRYEPTVTK